MVVSQNMTEEWKDFPVIDGRKFSKYEVSSLGQRSNKRSGRVFSECPKSNGNVNNNFLDDKGKSKNICAHVIVVRAFIGEPDSDDLTVDHINRERDQITDLLIFVGRPKNNKGLIQIVQNVMQ